MFSVLPVALFLSSYFLTHAPKHRKQFSTIYKEKTLGEWLLTQGSVKSALETKIKNEEYHAIFRVWESVRREEQEKVGVKGG